MVYIVGTRPYWRKSWLQFFNELEPVFVDQPEQVPGGETAYIWGIDYDSARFNKDVNVVHVEDGFIRSIGLGAALERPCSWVCDTRGIYFDATRPSDLESLLNATELTETERARAEALRQLLIENNISKYNTGSNKAIELPENKKAILVPGQVETDASIKKGSPNIKTNLELLKQVKANNPDAYIIYKPHPDVVAGLRKSQNIASDALAYCDAYITDINISTVLECVDEVHTMTSLCGFEGLLRGKRVTCYGQPFYSGWGLTSDKSPNERRTKQVDLSTLIYCALVLYARYVDPESGSKVTPEQTVQLLAERRTQPTRLSAKLKLLLRKIQTRISGRK
ncbi:hypothetical protein [Idiomarina sp.]|uniref:capsular polysaccharide export protein, LipB/KpsS family n=1 Tax=Idiomarina sp. TaxID=1874361 RepID=UPI0025BE6882|nr:hypothetical protein [Idiomarina sp.]NQZ03464.1 beta-3-deoxy-D-manno-oct-2-ulosonic acid transferase [Idiomarina sp.]